MLLLLNQLLKVFTKVFLKLWTLNKPGKKYSNMLLHGTLARKQRKGVEIQVNESKVFKNAAIFLEDSIVWITETVGGRVYNTYYDWDKITSVTTISEEEK